MFIIFIFGWDLPSVKSLDSVTFLWRILIYTILVLASILTWLDSNSKHASSVVGRLTSLLNYFTLQSLLSHQAPYNPLTPPTPVQFKVKQELKLFADLGLYLMAFFLGFPFFFFFTCLGISGFIFWLLKPLTLWFITWVLVFPSLIAREISQIKNCKNTLVTQCSILFSRVDFPPVSAFKYLLWIFPQSL